MMKKAADPLPGAGKDAKLTHVGSKNIIGMEYAMKMKRSIRMIAVVASLILCLLLTGCGAKKTAAPVSDDPAVEAAGAVAQSAAPAAAAMTATVPPIPLEEQQKILESNRELWAFDEQYQPPYFYTFTDLDHNGRLEVLSATVQGSSGFTFVYCYEVTADFTGVENCRQSAEAGKPDEWPDLVMPELPCYYDSAADRYYYIFEDVTRGSPLHQHYTWYALYLEDGAVNWEQLATMTVDRNIEGAEPMVTCKDAQGSRISEDQYLSAPERRFAGLQSSSLPVEWTMINDPFEPEPAPLAVQASGASSAARV